MARVRLMSLLCLFTGFGRPGGQLPITTSQYGNARNAANVNEKVLSPKNVNVFHFGKVTSFPVDGDVYAQPLYVPHISIAGKGVHDLIFVATEHDSVYAFDANTLSSTPVWHVNLLPSTGAAMTISDRDVRCPFITPEVGITSTPVIDAETGTLYVLARSKTRTSQSNVEYAQHLHALAITTGAEKLGGPIKIRATVPGSGAASSGGEVKFDPLRENPRAALLLSKGSVYLTWASSCDVGPYHGWVMAYDARTLQQQAALNTSPNAAESGIWMSDTGPAADEQGNVYVVTGNGRFDASSENARDYGDTVLKLSLRGKQLVVNGYFTPFEQEKLNSEDGDLGSGGPVLLPGPLTGPPSGLVFGGKAGVLYVIDPKQMGGLQVDPRNAAAETIRLSTGIYSAPAYWNGHLYYYAEGDALKDFVVNNGKLSITPAFRSTRKSKFSGGTPTVSADGTINGIVWLIETKAWNGTRGRAILRAYDALNVSRELYCSDQNPQRDQAGEAIRFTIPTVANGRVYIGVKKAVDVYGPLSR